jgi:tetratricopeptide (TPR) repeat protein
MNDPVIERLERAAEARRSGHLADARRVSQEAVSLARTGEGPPHVLVRALKALGQIDRDLGDRESALSRYQEAVALCRELGEPRLLAHAVRHEGDIHREAGRTDRAVSCYDEALALYRSDRGTRSVDLANALRSMALLRESLGEGKEAERLWREAQSLYASKGIQTGVEESATRIEALRRES